MIFVGIASADDDDSFSCEYEINVDGKDTCDRAIYDMR
jgi:hypothetical protein